MPLLAHTTKRSGLPLALTGVVVAAWLALWLWGSSPYASYLGHHQRVLAPHGWVAFTLFVSGWTLMTVAMMLPTASSLLKAFARVVQGRRQHRTQIALVAVGFVLVWLAIGIVFRVSDLAVHALVNANAWLGAHTNMLAAGAVGVAGLYQLTPVKDRCLNACRSPRGFIYRHWHGGRALADAIRIGLTYGLSCVGCCWALMFVMFALGLGSFIWMLALAAYMALEKNTTFGRRLRIPVGIILLAIAATIALTAGTQSHVHGEA
jgi:predicted metal-binding membrane protein